MKSYIQGMITGGVLVFAVFVLMGASKDDNKIGKFRIVNNFVYWILDSEYKMERNEVSILLNTENGKAINFETDVL